MTSLSDQNRFLSRNAEEHTNSGLVKRLHAYIGIYWLATLVVIAGMSVTRADAAPVIAPVSGEIQFISINDINDHWSGGTINVAGAIVTIPRNMLIDLPANRLTMQEIYMQAPADCVAAGETGLAKGDSCNHTGMGGIASISGNKTNGGNVIAGDVFIEKGVESVTGTVTYIDYNDGYFRINGISGDSTTGVMVRLNDPDGVHTVQLGLGCGDGPNCSADPRFTLDGSNYNNVFTTGYPLCIPSTFARSFTDVLSLGTTTAQASSNGTGDVLCPDFNRPAGGLSGTATDSRRFAPIQLGDHIAAEGNFETINGIRFLSAHSTLVSVALTTNTALANQPDYMIFEEVFMEAPGFQNQRMRNMFIGFTSVTPADVLIWSLHYDPVSNNVHEFPLASTAGCDAAAGVGSCTGQGLAVSGWDIFRIRYDVDFGIGARANLNPCAQLQAEPRFSVPGVAKICPNSPILDPKGRFDTDTVEMMGVMQPVAHEIQGRTGRKLASLQPGGVPLITLDIKGMESPNGQYLFPLGMNLGGIEVAEMTEIDLAKFATPLNFTGIPWNMDRRLSPGGCIDTTGDGIPDCEATPQPLEPFPFEGLAMDPRLQAPPTALSLGLPTGPYSDPNYTSVALTSVSNRVFSFVSGAGTFNGNATVFPVAFNWLGLAPLIDPPAMPIGVTPELTLMCFDCRFINYPPVAVDDFADAIAGVPVIIDVLANDSDPNVDPLTVTSVTVNPALGVATTNGTTVTYTPKVGTSGIQTFTYMVGDGQLYTTGNVTVTASLPVPPAAPTGMTASVLSTTSLQLGWTDNATTETGYSVEVSTNGGAYVALPELAANSTGYLATIAVGNTYSFQVRALTRNLGSTTPSTYLGPVVVDMKLPAAPTGIGAGLSSATQALVFWTDNATDETGYLIEVSADGGATFNAPSISLGANAAGRYVPIALGNTYVFRVSAKKVVYGWTLSSSSVSSGIVSANPPAAPINLTATPAPGFASVNLVWKDNANNESSFLIEVSEGGAGYTTLTSVSRNSVQARAVGDLLYYTAATPLSVNYTYRVTAVNVMGSSAPITASVNLTPQVAPATPTGVAAALSTASTSLVYWTDNANDETGYLLEQSTDGGVTWTTTVNRIQTAAQSSATGAIFGFYAPVTLGKNYIYRVSAYKTLYGVTYTSPTVMTGVVYATVPAGPTNLGSTSLAGGTQVNLWWTDNANNENGYLVEVSTDGGANYTTLTSVSRNSVQGPAIGDVLYYLHTPTTPGTTYTYRVRALNPISLSAPGQLTVTP